MTDIKTLDRNNPDAEEDNKTRMALDATVRATSHLHIIGSPNDGGGNREGHLLDANTSSKRTSDLPPFTHELRVDHCSTEALGVHLSQDFLDATGMDVWTRAFSDLAIVQLTEREQAEVVVSLNAEGNVIFTLTNPDSVKYGVQTLPTPGYDPVPPTIPRVMAVLKAMARWHYYLRLMPDSQPFKDKIDLEVYRLRRTGEHDDEGTPILEPDGPNINVDGLVNCVANSDYYYGLKVKNRSQEDLYIYIFDFSATGLAINWMRSRIPGFDHPDPTLPRDATITIGYGPLGPFPFMFELDEGTNCDVNIIKVVISAEEREFFMLEQEDPFSGSRDAPIGAVDQFFRRCLWDAFTVTMVQRPPSTEPEPTPAPVSESTSAFGHDSTDGAIRFSGSSDGPLLVQARSAAEASKPWFRTPVLTEEILGSIRCMKLQTIAKRKAPAGAAASEQTDAYFEISIIGSDELPKSTSEDDETVITYKSHSAPATSSYERTDGMIFDENHELWSKLEAGDYFEVSVCACGRGWANDADEGRLVFW